MNRKWRYLGQTSIGWGDNSSVDAFGRGRFSEPYSLFDSKFLFDKQPLLWDEKETGAGTSSTWSKDEASVTLAVSNSTAGAIIRQTFQRFDTFIGKSQLVFIAGTLGAVGGGAGITRKAGLFDEDNGIFFKDNEGVIEAVIRSNRTGTPVETAVAQADWNYDKLDGEGLSKITLNPLYSQEIFFDFSWGGPGRVRMGFVIDGFPIVCHEFLFANTIEGVFMSTPNLPLRYEIENDGTGIASELECMCASVITESGRQDKGFSRYNSTNGLPIQCNVALVAYVIAGIRLKSSHIGASVEPKNISVMNETIDEFEWVLCLNPTLDNPITFTDEPNSCVQFGVGNPGSPSNSTLSDYGTVIDGGIIKSSANSGYEREIVSSQKLLGSDIDGLRDELYLVAIPYSAGADIHGSITWKETA